MVADYRRGGATTYDLADRYGVHRNTVSAHLRARGLKPGHQPLSQEEAIHARTLRAQGLSLNAIGRAVRRDPKTVKTAIGTGAAHPATPTPLGSSAAP
jgi:DNA-binding CsgD family transcriptional regulator